MAEPLTLHLDNAAIQKMFDSPSGPVLRYVALRATDVQTRARRIIGEKTHDHPSIAPTIVKRFVRDAKGASVWVGSARTGPRVIVPKNATVLVFKPKGSASFVFAKRVNSPGLGPLMEKYLPEAARQAGLRVR